MIIIDLQDRRLDKGEGFRKEVDLSTSRDVSSERFSSLNAIVRLVVLFAGPSGRLLGSPGMIAALFSKCSISDCSALGFQKISKELEARVLTFLGVVLHRD